MGNGVSLRQGRLLDGKWTPTRDEMDNARKEDELYDWRKISSDELNKYAGSLYFVNSEGIKFYLPAFMSLAINTECIDRIVDLLCPDKEDWEYFELEYFELEYFASLNISQKHLIIQFLKYFDSIDDPDIDLSQLKTGLKFWNFCINKSKT